MPHVDTQAAVDASLLEPPAVEVVAAVKSKPEDEKKGVIVTQNDISIGEAEIESQGFSSDLPADDSHKVGGLEEEVLDEPLHVPGAQMAVTDLPEPPQKVGISYQPVGDNNKPPDGNF